MDHTTHQHHEQAPDPHAGHKMSNVHGEHDRHAGHSVAMFRDKFWLSFALTIPGSSCPSVVVNFKGITTLLLVSGFIP